MRLNQWVEFHWLGPRWWRAGMPTRLGGRLSWMRPHSSI
jgi:hypothetical protein